MALGDLDGIGRIGVRRLRSRGGGDFQTKLLQLFGADGGRRVAEKVRALLGLRKRNDVADGIVTGQEHGDAVQAEGQSAVRGGAVREGLQEKTEPFLRLL